ncbi:DUF4882 family protein [Acinetobacter sp.]|jgi:hypothetical protein|uniref:DUF4882 family protein n=1 Tax=Acinetobacter sp. TaxID=472 RepID=UPI00281BE70B|nr:DUF4882 family protein [Acinetobacter sp.]MDR0238429.1 DUF4882 domain-containing protein [Acinetobacter sp.]
MKRLTIAILTGLMSASGWSACTYDLDVTQATLDAKEPGAKVFPNINVQKGSFNISSTTTSPNDMKLYILSNNSDKLGSRKGVIVPQNTIYAFEYKFKIPTNQLTGIEQIVFFPIASTGVNSSGSQTTLISNLGYLNSSRLGTTPANTISISNGDASVILVNHNVTNTPDGYQHIGIYVNPSSKQVGYIINGVNKGYLANYDFQIATSTFIFGAGILGFTPTSPNIGKEISIELITDATKMTQTYPTGTKDICGNTI